MATPAHACPGSFAESQPLRHEPIGTDVAPVVAKITVVQREFGKATGPYVMFRVKVEQIVTGPLSGDAAMAVRYVTSCDRYPRVGDSGYVAGELHEGVLYVASFRMRDGKIGTLTPDLLPHLPGK